MHRYNQSPRFTFKNKIKYRITLFKRASSNSVIKWTHIRTHIFFFFLISNKDVYSRTLPHAESHKAGLKKIQRKKIKNRKKRC